MLAHSELLNNIAAALVKAQSEFPPIDMDGKGQVGQNRDYKYATLAHIISGVRPVLTANGLSLVQTCEPSQSGTVRVTTTLLHSSGQYLEGTLEMPAGSTAQQAGSAITYARRYSLAAILGIAADEDDDGAQASQGNRSRARTAPPVAPGRPTAGAAPAAAPTPLRAPAAVAAAAFNAASYDQMTPTTMTKEGRAWFFGVLKGDFGIDHEKAAALLGIKSFTAERPNVPLGDLLNAIKDKLAADGGDEAAYADYLASTRAN